MSTETQNGQSVVVVSMETVKATLKRLRAKKAFVKAILREENAKEAFAEAMGAIADARKLAANPQSVNVTLPKKYFGTSGQTGRDAINAYVRDRASNADIERNVDKWLKEE